MRIAIIDQGHRKYLMDMFVQHPDFDAEIVCFAEWQPKAQTSQGTSVIPLSALKEASYDVVLIAISQNYHLSRLLTYLYDENITNVYVIRLFALDTHTDFIAGTGFNMSCVDKMPGQNEKPYLVHLETHVCDHCNLNCKACNNFSPFVKNPICTDTAQFETDMQHLVGLFSNIGHFYLLGGEPLLEPKRCCEMIEIYFHYFPNSEVRLLTNAILVSKMPSKFWNCLREHNVIVYVSLYPPMFGKLLEVETILQKNNITYLLAGRLQRTEKFLKRMTRYPFEDAEFNNNHCRSAGCHYLRGGSISKCPDSVLVGYMASALGCSKEELQTRESIDLVNTVDAWEVIRALDAPIDMCKKCTLQRAEQFDWEVVGAGGADPSDWLLENRLEYERKQLEIKLREVNIVVEQREQQIGACEQELAVRSEQISRFAQRIIELEQITGRQVQRLAEQEQAIQRTQQEIHDCREKCSRLEQKLKSKEQELTKEREDHDAICASYSFQLGRILTWLPRKLRKELRQMGRKRRGISCVLKNIVKNLLQVLSNFLQ